MSSEKERDEAFKKAQVDKEKKLLAEAELEQKHAEVPQPWRTAEIVPLPFLRTLVVNLGDSGVSLGDMHQRVAPLVRAPQRLRVEKWEEVDE